MPTEYSRHFNNEISIYSVKFSKGALNTLLDLLNSIEGVSASVTLQGQSFGYQDVTLIVNKENAS